MVMGEGSQVRLPCVTHPLILRTSYMLICSKLMYSYAHVLKASTTQLMHVLASPPNPDDVQQGS